MLQKWTEELVASRHAEGRGQGEGHDYKPWLQVRDIHSYGRKHLVPCTRFGREIHLFSDNEYRMYLLLEWSHKVVEVREQFPLDRELTRMVAKSLGIRHPCYDGTNVYTVLTTDFLVTMTDAGRLWYEAFNVKEDSAANEHVVMCKLEIQRSTLAQMSIPHHVVFSSMLCKKKAANLDWLRNAGLKKGEKELWPGYFEEMATRLLPHLRTYSVTRPSASLSEACAEPPRVSWRPGGLSQATIAA